MPGEKDIAVSSWLMLALDAITINVFTILGHSPIEAQLNYTHRSGKDRIITNQIKNVCFAVDNIWVGSIQSSHQYVNCA